MTEGLSFFRTVPIGLGALLAIIFGVLYAFRVARDRGRSGLWALLGLALGPVAPAVVATLPRSDVTSQEVQRWVFVWKAVAWSLPVGLLVIAGSFALGYLGFEERGEALQPYVVGGLILGGLLSGFLASVVAHKVAYLETLTLDLVLLGAFAVIADRAAVAFSYGTTPVFVLVVLIAAVLILDVSRILGGSLGFMIVGDGKATLQFGYEVWIGRRYLMAKRRSSFISVITIISIGGVAVGVWAMLVVLSVMSGFMTDLRGKILGANAHLIVLRYGTDFTEYDEVVRKVSEVEGVTGASPFVLNEVMVSSEINLSGAIIKGINPVSAPLVSDLDRNMIQGALENLRFPERIAAMGRSPTSQPHGGGLGTPRAPPTPVEDPGHMDHATDLEDSDAAELDDLLALDTDLDGDSNTVLPGIIVGQELARSLKVFLGDPVNVVSPVGELGPTGPVPKAKVFRVVGVFYSGMYEYDAKFVYVDLEEAQSFFTTNGAVTGVEVKVDDIEATTAISRVILRDLGGYPYRTKDWKEMNRNLFSALKLEKIAMFIILTFIILVASFNILSTLIMVVIEKGKEISILKSMGATDPSIMKIFVVYGLVIGAVGTAIGILLGLVSCLAIREFGVGLDPEVYYISELPVRMNPIEFAVVAISAMVVSYLATIYPSLQAARLHPVDGLRYD